MSITFEQNIISSQNFQEMFIIVSQTKIWNFVQKIGHGTSEIHNGGSDRTLIAQELLP